jgi:hypothetical protein
MTDSIRLSVDLGHMAGASISEVARKMSVLSGRVGIPVCCEFNGVDVTVVEGDDPALIEDHYLRAIKLGLKVVSNNTPTAATERWIADCSGRD